MILCCDFPFLTKLRSIRSNTLLYYLDKQVVEMRNGVLGICVGLFLLSSCVSHKKFINFQTDGENSQIANQDIANQIAITIQPDDILAIRVSSFDAKAAAPFNLTSSGDQLREQNLRISDFLVDADGNIDFPGLGTLKVSGFTLPEAKTFLLEKLAPFLKDAIVNIRLTNFRVNVLGEVRIPGAISTIDQTLTIVEAITQAGDISDFGNREQVQIIREQNGKREFAVLNLLSSEIFSSPYYYLRQNDIIYVPPTKGRTTTVSAQPFSSVILPVLGVGISLTSLIISISR